MGQDSSVLRHQGEQEPMGRFWWGIRKADLGWELRLVLDTSPAVHKSHLEFVLQAEASHKRKGGLIGLGLCFRKITGSLGEDEVTVLRAERDRALCCQLE